MQPPTPLFLLFLIQHCYHNLHIHIHIPRPLLRLSTAPYFCFLFPSISLSSSLRFLLSLFFRLYLDHLLGRNLDGPSPFLRLLTTHATMAGPFFSPLLLSFALLTLFTFTGVLGLQVAENSECASLCLDSPGLSPANSESSNTNTSDITCSDNSYGSTTGQKFKDCVSCLQVSNSYNLIESDQDWFLCEYLPSVQPIPN